MINTENKNIKILVSYHKQDFLLDDDVFVPINAGRQLAVDNNSKDLEWLSSNCIGDNTGENISLKNRLYNEMTSIFWAWKNYDKLGNPDYIGHFHYRRHLSFLDSDRSVLETHDVGTDYLSSVLGYSHELLASLCDQYDLIIPKPQHRASAYEHYKRNFNVEELELAVFYLKKLFPEYSDCADKYLDGTGLFFCNLFIMKKELFYEYCSFAFPIMEMVEKQFDMTGKRMYISEWLTGIYIQKKIDEGINTKMLTTVIAESSNIIPVVFASDDNYMLQMGVAITSMLKNSKDNTFYDVRCLVPDSSNEDLLDKIKRISDEFNNCSVRVYKINDDLLPEVVIHTHHISKVCFFRLLIPNILDDLDKVIYLDDDVLISSDLTTLYRFALDDNYLAGVRAPGYYAPDDWRRDKLRELDIPFINQYINSGVLLLNLKKLREDNKVDDFLDLMKNSFRSEDQDVLNASCYGKIKILPYRFNVQTKYMGNSKEAYKLAFVIPNDEIEDALKTPVIIHYANPLKPWNDLNSYMAEEWMKVALNSILHDDLKSFYAFKQWKARELEKKLISFEKEIIHRNVFTIPNNATDADKNYKVSVIIPCYNSQCTINETLHSAVLQTSVFTNIEIICVDDGSTDSTLDILSQWAEKFWFIKIFVQPNKGAGPARNLGIKVAKGEFISFLDADDMYPSPTTIENLYFSATKNRADICGGSYSTIYNGNITKKYDFPLDGYTFNERKVIDYKDYQFDFGYQRFIFKRRFLIDKGLVFPNYRRYQDPPFFVSAMIAAERFMCVPETTYLYRINHKKVNWDHRKICDFMKGVIDCLSISKNKGYSTLHLYSYLRFWGQIDDIRKELSIYDIESYGLFNQLCDAIDFKLLFRSPKYQEGLFDCFNKNDLLSLLSAKGNANIVVGMNNPESSFSGNSKELTDRIDNLQKTVDELNYIISETRKSFSYRIGLAITFIPRKIRAALKK